MSERRTIGELVARYTLEPSLKDIYVEGRTDRALIALALDSWPRSHGVNVYDIDSVHIPPELLATKGFTEGNKARVLTLADELDRECTESLTARVVCLADRDLDTILGAECDCPLVVYTSGPSLDLVVASPTVLGKLLTVVMGGSSLSPRGLLTQLSPVLAERLLQRVALRAISPNAVMLSAVKDLTFEDGALEFDANRYITRLLSKNAIEPRRDEFLAAMDAYRPRMPLSPQPHAHIDDFFECLHLCVRTVKPRRVPGVDHFRRFLLGFVEGPQVAALPELREVRRRFGV
jgi:hypothetical protein